MASGRLAASLSVLRALVRSPSLARVMLAYLLFSTVEYGSWIAILLYGYDAIGAEAIGVVALVQLVPSALFAAVAATIADRYPRHLVLLAGYAAQAATIGLTAAGMLLGLPPVLVLVMSIVASCVLTMTRPAQWALLPGLARTPEELTAANGVSGSLEGLGALLGPLAAAGVLAVGTPGAVFAASAVVCGAAAVLVVRLPAVAAEVPTKGGPVDEPEARLEAVAGVPDASGGPAAEAPSPVARVAGGLRALTGGADARLVVGLLSVQMVVLGATEVLFVLLAIEVLGTGESGAAILGAAAGLGLVAGGVVSFVLAGRRRLAPLIAAGGCVLGGSLVALGLPVSPLAAVVLIAIGGLGSAALDITGRTVLQRVTDGRSLVRVLGALEGIGILGAALGSLVAPLVAEAADVQAALVLAGLVLPAAVALAIAPLRRIDRRVRIPARELALLRADPILAPLPAPQLEAVASAARWLTLAPGQVLIREGDRGDRYFVLESGALRISQAGRVLRDEAGRGYGLGEIALLRDVPRTATAVALQPSVLLALERADFLQAVTGHEQAGALARRRADERVRGPVEAGPDGG